VTTREKSTFSEWKALAEGEILLKAKEIARVTGLSTETLAQWRSQGRGIPFLKMSRNAVRYRQSDLNEWLAARFVNVEAEHPASRRKG
jgi:excisionase family DNA binding protein